MEEESVYSSKINYNGYFSFKDLYTFCYNWLRDETGITAFSEDKYSEKISGESKGIDIEWSGHKDLTDYFRQRMKITFKIIGLTKVKVKVGNGEKETDKGSVEIKVKGSVAKDYQNKFEMTAFKKTLRAFYEKHIIQSTVKEFKGKINASCDEFLSQAKAFLDLEGRKD
jgi:hypothetical protein